MGAYFSAERVQQLLAGQEEVHHHYRELCDKMCLRTYKTARGGEYAKQGFCRRLETLVRSIDRVYELLPPSQEAIPERDVVVDAAITIQAFTMNAFGCLDNIAWIWVYEKGITNSDGTELEPKDVGLGKKKIRKALTKDYLDGKQQWFGNLIDFRDPGCRKPSPLDPGRVGMPGLGPSGYNGSSILRRDAAGCLGEARQAGNLQYRPRFAVHRGGLHRCAR